MLVSKLDKLTFYILFSICLHLATAALIADSSIRKSQNEKVSVDIVIQEKQHREMKPPTPAAEILKQVVDQSRSPSSELDNLNSRFLSQHNHSVKKQTTAKKAAVTTLTEHSLDNEAEGESKAVLSETIESLDYIKDLDPGTETMLNTNEFTYYSFYHQVRTQVTPQWGSKIRERLDELARRGHEISDTEEKTTRLLVTLKLSGQILKVQVIGNSGNREFDEAAVEAFRSAAPFANPPKGMIDSDGNIKIRWNFVVEN